MTIRMWAVVVVIKLAQIYTLPTFKDEIRKEVVGGGSYYGMHFGRQKM